MGDTIPVDNEKEKTFSAEHDSGNEVRCPVPIRSYGRTCGNLFFKGSFERGKIEIWCRSCKTMVTLVAISSQDKGSKD